MSARQFKLFARPLVGRTFTTVRFFLYRGPGGTGRGGVASLYLFPKQSTATSLLEEAIRVWNVEEVVELSPLPQEARTIVESFGIPLTKAPTHTEGGE